jgi:hypothetical protein
VLLSLGGDGQRWPAAWSRRRGSRWRAAGPGGLRRLAASLMSGEGGGRASRFCDLGGDDLLVGVGHRNLHCSD